MPVVPVVIVVEPEVGTDISKSEPEMVFKVDCDMLLTAINY